MTSDKEWNVWYIWRGGVCVCVWNSSKIRGCGAELIGVSERWGIESDICTPWRGSIQPVHSFGVTLSNPTSLWRGGWSSERSFACILGGNLRKRDQSRKSAYCPSFSNQLKVNKLKMNKMVITSVWTQAFQLCSPRLYWHHVAKQTQAQGTVGKRLMRALFDFLFGKPLGDAETAFTILKSRLIMGTRNTQSGSSKFKCGGIRPPGDLLKECRCFLSSAHSEMTLII